MSKKQYKRKLKKDFHANQCFREWLDGHTISTFTNCRTLICSTLRWDRQKWHNTIKDKTPLNIAEQIAIESLLKETIF